MMMPPVMLIPRVSSNVVTLQGKLPVSWIVAIRGSATKGREGGDAEAVAHYIGGPIHTGAGQALNRNKIL